MEQLCFSNSLSETIVQPQNTLWHYYYNTNSEKSLKLGFLLCPHENIIPAKTRSLNKPQPHGNWFCAVGAG